MCLCTTKGSTVYAENNPAAITVRAAGTIPAATLSKNTFDPISNCFYCISNRSVVNAE